MGFINWCKFGFHSYEEISDKTTIREVLIKKLHKLGFEEKSGAVGSMWQHIELEIFINKQNIDNFIPMNPTTFVCLECEKVTSNYDFDEVVRRFTTSMQLSIDASRRKLKAKEIAQRNAA